MITTFGVSELPALNGVAGSYAEYVLVVHIVWSSINSFTEEWHAHPSYPWDWGLYCL